MKSNQWRRMPWLPRCATPSFLNYLISILITLKYRICSNILPLGVQISNSFLLGREKNTSEVHRFISVLHLRCNSFKAYLPTGALPLPYVVLSFLIAIYTESHVLQVQNNV